MKYRKYFRLIITFALLFIVISDSDTAKVATKDGINLCLNTVLPGILIFLFIGNLLSDDLMGFCVPFLESAFGIPKCSCGYFFVGQLCGYPVGAKLLQDASRQGKICSKDAMRMICFCNNASPAFIIGILSSVFQNQWVGIIMWLIQIASSILLAILTRKEPAPWIPVPADNNQKKQQITDILKTASTICTWIILFKILLGYLDKVIIQTHYSLPKTLLWGSLEVTNGLMALKTLNTESLQFVISSFFLSFGGICVLLQTRAVAPDLPMKQYILSRLLHSGVSCLLASLSSYFLFKNAYINIRIIFLFAAVATICYIIFYFNQNNGSIQRRNVV